jgi:hypothetical protein
MLMASLITLAKGYGENAPAFLAIFAAGEKR